MISDQPREYIIRKVVTKVIENLLKSASIDFKVLDAIEDVYGQEAGMLNGNSELEKLKNEVKQAMLTRIQYRS